MSIFSEGDLDGIDQNATVWQAFEVPAMDRDNSHGTAKKQAQERARHHSMLRWSKTASNGTLAKSL
jgi:hypothetical protein